MLPFSESDQLVRDLEPQRSSSPGQEIVPGQPQLALRDADGVNQFLADELYGDDIETMAPRLWIMSTFSSSNINPLHRQRVKGREIVVTEDPRLHLVWYHNRIFIKPVPRCLLSHKFWEVHLDSDQSDGQTIRIRKAALGFLRTYRYLVRHESDLRIAQREDLCLLPQDVDWVSFCRFASALAQIEDSEVSGRYYFGELRLTRLNLYAPLLLRRFQYEPIHGQYSDFFGRLFGPVLFVFAVVSIMLNSMQVELAVEQLVGAGARWSSFWSASRWFSVLSLVGGATIAFWLIVLWLWVFLDEWVYTVRRKLEKGRISQARSAC